MKPYIPGRFALTLAASLLLSNPLLAAPGDILFSSEFNTDGVLEGWVDNGDRMKAFGWDGVTITGEEEVVGGVFRAKVTQGATTANDAQLVRTPFSPTVNANLAGSIQIRIRQSPDDGATWKTAGALTGFLVRLTPNPTSPFNPDGSLAQTSDETVAGDGWTILTYNIDNYVHQNLNNFRFDPSDTLEESFEIDYIRILETSNPRPVTEVNPASAIPEQFNLVRQWDEAAELNELAVTNFTSNSTGNSSLGGPDQSLFCVNSTTGDPQLLTPSGLNIPVAPSDQMIVEIGFIPSTLSTMDNAQIFWSDSSGGFGAVRRLDFPTQGLTSGVRHVIRATFTNNINSQLNQLRFDPLTTAGKDFELEYIRIYTTPGVGGYSTWANANAGGQTPELDFDNDGVRNGVEYFMGETGSSFTPNPGIVDGTITWPKDPAFVGSFRIQVSDDLDDWTDILPPHASIDESDPNEVVFTPVAGDPKKFVRLAVEVTP